MHFLLAENENSNEHGVETGFTESLKGLQSRKAWGIANMFSTDNMYDYSGTCHAKILFLFLRPLHESGGCYRGN